MVLLGCGLWDALWQRSPSSFATELGPNLERLTKKLKFGFKHDTRHDGSALAAAIASAAASSSYSSSSSSLSSFAADHKDDSEGNPPATALSLPLVLWLDSTAVSSFFLFFVF